MDKLNHKEKSYKPLSRAQTAKIRKNLEKSFFNIKTKKLKSSQKNYPSSNRPFTSYHDRKLSQLYLPPTELISEQEIINKENEEYQKAHLNEINIQNLFTEKLWYKNNLEKNEDYTKNIEYKKLIMRAKLLKAMKTNIVLRQKDFDDFNTKYYKGSRLLSEKLKKKKMKNSEDDITESDIDIKERPNFISLKNPDIFSEYEYTSLFQDYFCSPIELIQKIFNSDEQKIINLDPLFFRLNRKPFIGVQKNMGFSLKDKINEEDRIERQKIERMKEINKKFNYVRRKHTRRGTGVENIEVQKDSSKIIKTNINNNITKTKKSPHKEKYFFPNNDIINKNKNKKNNKEINYFDIFSSTKKKSNKKNKALKLDLSEWKKNNKKDDIFTRNTDYNVYLEIKKNQKKKNHNIINYIYNDGEKIKDKKKRLTMEELLDMYNERKKLYLEDMSYNRKKNKYRFEKLRIKKYEENEKENEKKEKLRKLLNEIEENYKLYQK